MSRRIDCTLTDAQWDLLWWTLADYECHLQDNLADGVAGPWGRELAVLNRLCDRVAGVSA